MIIKVYAIKDKLQGFLTPTCNVNDECAKRDFAFALNNNPGIMNFSPKDYDLYRIGEYNSDSGEIDKTLPIFICSGIEVFANEK